MAAIKPAPLVNLFARAYAQIHVEAGCYQFAGAYGKGFGIL